jgi:hypothetical protein
VRRPEKVLAGVGMILAVTLKQVTACYVLDEDISGRGRPRGFAGLNVIRRITWESSK